ncbi:carbamoyl-phosphate synth [Coniophora puteana RWD-64-598 SS2]|uniref:Pyrimidine-specific carbamoyl phosphate synthase-aspartate carbamoyl transferase n=1 Tax=Coniophora puteana (strain RWD-64-598) TaxID=741705 RepID=A0A5M3MF48_CONPW|nr:carbamoyl-phosphate synth [Coniophora puteana RWD-64-598 SS2]EIW77899.1 carbamoyl-phosphate synth [Coniophora puteana RWD-64-598 SS2]
MSFANGSAAPVITRPSFPRLASNHGRPNGLPAPLATFTPIKDDNSPPATHNAVLELSDGSSFEGISFGAEGKSVAGECVFQTGMVGYTESLTDPSYEGQILVLTYPLIGNYGVPTRPKSEDVFPENFESSRIHVAALVVGSYTEDYSHFLADSSLAAWLKENDIPAIFGVDTRALTKRIREKGSMLARIMARKSDARSRTVSLDATRTPAGSRPPSPPASTSWREDYTVVPFHDPNQDNLVAAVSIKKPRVYAARGTPRKHPSGRPLRVVAVDVGMKYNQIRCFVERGVELKVVPWDYDFTSDPEPYDGLFLSNGPGDPSTIKTTVDRLRGVLEKGDKPVFGICLGHQLLALAAGAKTSKMKYGNRGHNIPCTDALSGRCYITSQNHGYQVDADTLPAGWKELFRNANDESNEGIYCEDRPFFSVQFHPESTPGPRDTEFLFDVFIRRVEDCASVGALNAPPLTLPGGRKEDNDKRVPRAKVQKVLILGSGGLSIGQAGEFDYSGSQAIKALKEEGIYTILVNPNIATIATSKGLADKVYFLPVTPEFVRKIIAYEKPDGIYVTFGGQTALNVGIKLRDEFEGMGVQVLGTPVETIITTEDRQLFAQAMESIGERCAQSATATTPDEAVSAANAIGFPVIVRAAYALGGLGSGFAQDEAQLRALCSKAFATSPQVLVEKSMKGWKEIEYEVVRDCRDNCITVCNMENFDPLGIHTGDSIVVAPSQTLSDADYNMLRTTAINVIRHLGVVGECNIQYALNPTSREFCIIEVNARLSRSSALASKATGYPLAFIAAKLGLGIPLNEIKNSVTKLTSACFEPSLDYCVVKIPRWDLKKFSRVSRLLSSSMKSVGEVMAIGRSFEETIQKAIRAIDDSFLGFSNNDFVEDIDEELVNPTDKRIFAIASAFHRGYSVDKIWQMTNIDKWFLTKLQYVHRMEKQLLNVNISTLRPDLLRSAKQLGFSDKLIATCLGSTELAVRRLRQEASIAPYVKQIDTVAAEFPAFTNYLYTTYNAVEHDIDFEDRGVMVLGSGVYRIGSSVEFDWCAVRAIRTLREQGFPTVMVNYNPETVSTDYDEADKLYFENISLETILDIYDTERSRGVILSMGGQTPNNIALPLFRQNVKIYGTSPEMIDTAENRFKFSRLLDEIGVDQPQWKELTSFEEAHTFCNAVGYPVLVRPSYVLSGAAMNVVSTRDDLSNYLTQATAVSREHPVVITKYIEQAKEIEMDAVAKDGKMIMHFISEHVENAGVHSGDATLIHPPQDLDPTTVRQIEEATAKIGNALNVTGPFNIQFIAKNNEIKVIECNLRAARSFPFVSKVTGIDAIEMATKVMLGLPVEPYPDAGMPADYVGVKVPQFSFSRLSGADPVLGVEMASTGEVACFGKDKYEAYLKALISTGIVPPEKNILFSVGSYKEKLELLPSVQKLAAAGYNIFATAGTSDFLTEHNVPCKYLESLDETGGDKLKSEYSLTQHLANNLIDMYINLPSKNNYRRPASYTSKGYKTRRMAVDFAVPLITNVKNAKMLAEALVRKLPLDVSTIDSKSSHITHTFPGLVNVASFVPDLTPSGAAAALRDATTASISAGFTASLVLPVGVSGAITDAETLEQVRHIATQNAYCNYALSIAATDDNVNSIDEEIRADVKSLFIPFRCGTGSPTKISTVAAHFASWPSDKLIVADAQGSDLASVLLLASLHNRTVHITDVRSEEDLLLISLSKAKNLKVTCDLSVFLLFFSKEQFPESSSLVSASVQKTLWKNLDAVDAFSVGATPFRLASELGESASAWSGAEETLPLLLNAVTEGRLTLDDIRARLHDNPIRIFGLPEQTNTHVEVVVGRRHGLVRKASNWSPLDKTVTGSVHRVVVHGKTLFLDGTLSSTLPLAKDISSASISHGVADRQTPALVVSKPEFVSPLPPMSHRPSADVASQHTLGTSTTLMPQPGNFQTLTPHPAFHRRHILSVKQFTQRDMYDLFSLAHEMRLQVERNGTLDILRGKVLCTLFYEPSTRTSASFDAAMKRCGGEVIQVTADTSSVKKGETLADTIRTVGCYADAIAIRHPDVGSSQHAAKFSPVPVLNCGDGVGEHPTQALLDVYTIRSELGTVNGKTITLLGDLKNGRTVHSLVTLLCHYSVRLNFVSPSSLAMPASVIAAVRKAGVSVTITESLEEVLGDTDVLYVTRVQKERFESEQAWMRVRDSYRVDHALLARAKEEMIVMHPLPRVNEIDPEVDFDSRRAVYFRQMRYGLFIRMALLASVMA